MKSCEFYDESFRKLKFAMIDDIKSFLEKQPDKKYFFKKPITVQMDLTESLRIHRIDTLFINEEGHPYVKAISDGINFHVGFLLLESILDVYGAMQGEYPMRIF